MTNKSSIFRPAIPGLGQWLPGSAYVFSVVVTLAALLARMQLQVVFAERPLLIFFMLPIILSAYGGGLWPGLTSTLVASVSVNYFFIPPVHSLQIAQTHDFIQWLILIVSGGLISVLNESLHRSRKRVVERTAELSNVNRALRTISDCNQELVRAEPDAFNAAEVKLLTELANDLAYGVTALRTRAAHEHAEAALKEREQRLSSIYDTAADVIFHLTVEKDGRYRFTSVNRAFLSVTGLAYDQVVGKCVDEVIPEPSLTLVLGNYETAIREKRIVRWEETSEFPTGRLTGEVSVAPVVDDAGNCTHLVGAVHDITERKQAEERLRESEQRYRHLFENIQETFVVQEIVVDNTGKPIDLLFLDINPAAERSLGKKRSEIVGRTRSQVSGRPDPEGVEMASRVASTGEPFHMIRQSAGFGSWFESFTYSLGSGIVATLALDITERKKAEETLRESEARFHRTLDSMLEGCQIIDFGWRYLYINDSVARHGQRARAELLGRTMMEVYPGIEETSMFDVLRQCMTERTPQRLENLFYYPDGSSAWFDLSVQPVPEGVFILSIDITDRKRAEQQLSETLFKLERNNRELQDFAYVASHDLQEPLRKIQAFGDRLVAHSGAQLDEQGRDYLGRMHSAAARMQTLINDLLTFSRVTTKAQPFALVDLNQILRGVLSDLEVRIEQSRGRVEAAPLPVVEADATQMRQVFQNLISNALKFHKPNALPVVKGDRRPHPARRRNDGPPGAGHGPARRRDRAHPPRRITARHG
jgi:PAS domain S-box-containing protein